jgi:hypothetical protein
LCSREAAKRSVFISLRFHLAPFRTEPRAQIVTAKVKFSNILAPFPNILAALCERSLNKMELKVRVMLSFLADI